MSQIDALLESDDPLVVTDDPEGGEDKGSDGQKAEDDDPEELQDVGEGHELQKDK